MRQHLSGAHAQTYKSIFQHPVSHNLEWKAVRAMFSEMGEIVEEHNGNLKITINGLSLMLPRPHGKDITSVEELMKLRHFIEASGISPKDEDATPSNMLVVIDHAGAKVYHLEMKDEMPHHIVPYDPKGLERHVHTSKTDISIHEKANRKKFYEEIAKSVDEAGKILVFGDGAGSSSEMNLLVEEFKENHPKVASHIVNTCIVDLHHRTEGELLAKAKEFFQPVAVTSK
jgi:hypothetical protein